MLKRLSFIVLVCCCAGIINAQNQQGKLFVKLKDSTSVRLPSLNKSNISTNFRQKPVPDTTLQRLFSRYQVQNIDHPFPASLKSLQNVYELSFADTSQTDAFIEALENLSFVEYAEPVPLYKGFYDPDDLHANQWNLPKVNAADAWDIATGSGDVTIAIVDDAVLLNHEDLQNAIWNNPDESSNGIDDDNNGYVDDIHGYDVADNDNDPNPPATATNRVFTHGTHCAGIASAHTDNGTGIAALGFQTRIIAVKTKPDGETGPGLPFAHQGVAYAIASGADVISMSWGGYSYSNTYQLLMQTARNRGITLVAAAGNNDTDIPMYPASYDHVISVGATDDNDQKASFSNYGSTVDVMAPGVDIWSTLAGTQDAYGHLSGTSMACPLVAGLAGLMSSYNAGYTPDSLENCIKSSAVNIDGLNSGYETMLGAGRIDAHSALLCMQEAPLAAFKAEDTVVCPGSSIQFTDQSSGVAPLNYDWTFQGGTPAAASVANPEVTYNSPGVYPVELTVTNDYGQETLTKTQYIEVAAPQATLSGTTTIPSGGNALLQIAFNGGPSPRDIVYSRGSITDTIRNISVNPFTFSVSPDSSTTFQLSDVMHEGCSGNASGAATITVDDQASEGDCYYTNAYGDNNSNTVQQMVTDTLRDVVWLVGHDEANSMLIVNKLSQEGDIIWTRSFEPGFSLKSIDAALTDSGGIIASGESAGEVFAIKVEEDGSHAWSKRYTFPDNQRNGYIANAGADKYVIAAWSGTGTSDDLLLLGIDGNGSVLWSKTLEGGSDQEVYTMLRKDGGGCFVAGLSSSGNITVFLIEVDNDGNILQDTEYSGVSDYIAPGGADGMHIRNGKLVMSGASYQESAFIMQTNVNDISNVDWGYKVPDPSGNIELYHAGGMTMDNAGNVYMSSAYGNNSDGVIAKYNANGLIWMKRMTNMPYRILMEYDQQHESLFLAQNSRDPENFNNSINHIFIKSDTSLNTCKASDMNVSAQPVTLQASSWNFSEVTQNPQVTDHTTTSGDLVFSANVACDTCTVTSCTADASFTVSDSSICTGDTAWFNYSGQNASAYKWIINDSLYATTSDTAHVFNHPGKFKVYLTTQQEACSATDSILITVHAGPELIVSPEDTLACHNDSIQLSASGAEDYNWMPGANLSCTDCPNPVAGPGQDSTYTVTGTDTNGCRATATATLSYTCCTDGIPGPVADFTTDDSLQHCKGDSVRFINTSVYSNENTAFYWDFGNNAQPATSTQAHPGSVWFETSGAHPVRLIVDDSCGRDTIVRNVNIFPLPTGAGYNDTTICEGTTLNFDAVPISDYSYRWIPSAYLSDPFVIDPALSVPDDTTISYVLRISDEVTGCASHDTIQVTTTPRPVANAGSDTTLTPGERLELNGCCGSNYTWSPADYLDNAFIQNPVTSPEEAITYRLTTENSQGCTASDTIRISLNHEVFIPKMFSPNGDGMNDVFKVYGHGISNIRFEVYNRWGEKVYETSSVESINTAGWKGTRNGEKLPEGTYTWKCRGHFMNGQPLRFKGKNAGTLLLVR